MFPRQAPPFIFLCFLCCFYKLYFQGVSIKTISVRTLFSVRIWKNPGSDYGAFSLMNVVAHYVV